MNRVAPLRAAIHRFRPDVIAMDALYETMIAAHLECVPYGRIHTSLTLVAPQNLDCEVFRSSGEFAAQRHQLFEHFGVEPEWHGIHTLSPWLNCVFATREFIGDVTLPARTVLVGPSVPRVERRRFSEDQAAYPDEPIAYISFGTTVIPRQDLVDLLVETFVARGFYVVLRTEHCSRDWGPRVSAVRHAPQLAVLERASVFVTHGGANSVMESLHAGVPMLVIPHAFEQPVRAYFVEKSGAGLSADPATIEPSPCRTLIDKLLGSAHIRERAQQIGGVYRSLDGARDVAARLESLT
jgi:UDP:flavonoid glycosyltransferase YjiC (YdhE family)